MNNKLVSIVIPTYKGNDNICLAIDSALSQDYKNIEVIVVDDNGVGTPGQRNTEAVIKKYANDSRVRYICHPYNINGSAARNTGIKAAQGDYIALLDDDDIFYPHKIRLQYEALCNSSAAVGLCYTAFDIKFPDGRERYQEAVLEGDICLGVLCKTGQIPSSVMMFKKNTWEIIGGFDESFVRHQDWEFLARLSREYQVIAIKTSCLQRVIMQRNSAKNAEKFKNLRVYYLEKMLPIISVFPQQQQEEIYYVHYADIAKEYVKKIKLIQATKYAFKSGQPFATLRQIIRDGCTYVGARIVIIVKKYAHG